VYINSAKLNNHLMQGTFKEALRHVPALVKELKALIRKSPNEENYIVS
jgi:hypothetical protein